VLRAGVGSADALTRGHVAHRIDRPVRVVRRYERRGVRRLRQAARAGECTPAAALPAPDGTGVSGGTATTDADVAEGTTIAAGTDGEGGTDAARGGADGGGRGGVKGESRERGPIAGIVPPVPGPKDITLPFLLLVLAMAAVGGVWMIRRARDAAERWPDAGA
jgi:hypothetical protein